MKTKRRQYTEEFKREAVQHCLASEKSVGEIAGDLGIAYSNLKRWYAQHHKRGELAFPGHGKERLTPQEEENRRLKKELNDITQECNIVKKVLAIFTKKP